MENYEKSGSNKSVLITGCSSGIGFATAQHLAKAGFTVFASVRSAASAEKLRLLNEPNLIPIYPLDLTRLDDIPPLVDRIQAELRKRNQPGLYALINNAGGGAVAPLELMDLKAFQIELQTRLVGAVALIQAFLPLLREGSGRIVWIMTPATIPTPYVTSIHACDFAVNCIARTLDIELKLWNIPNIQIRCGGVRTAKGLETTFDVEKLLLHPKAGLYRQPLTRWARDMSAFDQKRTEPGLVAKLVEKSLRARKPKRQYSIGYILKSYNL